MGPLQVHVLSGAEEKKTKAFLCQAKRQRCLENVPRMRAGALGFFLFIFFRGSPPIIKVF